MEKEKLLELLERAGINVDAFGVGKAKTLEHLLTEVNDGESKLVESDGKLVRKLRVLSIDVYYQYGGERYHLVEDRQVFKDGRERKRNLSASVGEKIHADEDLNEAVTRALAEELGIRHFSITSPFSDEVKETTSPSFPGLVSEYQMHSVAVEIYADEYRTEYVETQEDKSTYFVWE